MLAFLFSPSGRIGRAKWWLAQMISITLVLIAAFMLIGVYSVEDHKFSGTDLMEALAVLVIALFLMWMLFCVASKRYHDRGKSAWWFLIQFIPFVGPIWQLVELGFCSGDDGDNDYGPGPDLNIEEDLKAMMTGLPNTAQSAPQRAAVAPAYQAARVSNSGSPVFGKRG